ncbi:MAG: DUF3159 domain-containing protein [Bacillota bacterium]
MDITKEEILEELKSVFLSRTSDAILPPLTYAVINSIFGLNTAVLTSIVLAFLIAFYRARKNQNWKYSAGGIIVILLASGLAYYSKNASNYFLPAIISSSFFVLLSIISIIIGRPLAAWASHLSRGWPLKWFWRQDVKPAYREVTLLWTIFFSLRLSIQLYLFLRGSILHLAWINLFLGWPMLTAVLIISYVYGIWRLKNLGGPGVDEYRSGKEPPWEGQKRGF